MKNEVTQKSKFDFVVQELRRIEKDYKLNAKELDNIDTQKKIFERIKDMSMEEIILEIEDFEKNVHTNMQNHPKISSTDSSIEFTSSSDECDYYNVQLAKHFKNDSIVIHLLLNHPECFSEAEKKAFLRDRGVKYEKKN